MNKLIFILSILPVVFCSEHQVYQEYGSPIANYENEETQYSQPEINNKNEFSSVYKQLSTQQLPIEDYSNFQSNYFNTPPKQEVFKLDDVFNHLNTPNFMQNPLSNLNSFEVKKSEEIPVDFLKNTNTDFGDFINSKIATTKDSNYDEIQNLIKEFLYTNYVNTQQLNNNQQNILDSGNSDNNVNYPKDFSDSTTELQKIASNQLLSNQNLNKENEKYNPSSFEYENQNFPQINPNRVYFNQFIMKPAHQIPNSIFQIPIPTITSNSVNNLNIMSIPQNQYSTDFINRIHSQPNRLTKYYDAQNGQNPKTKTKITTQIYSYDDAPNETDEEILNEQLLKQISPRKHYKVIFIKAPHQISRNTLKLVQTQAQNEQQTVIYVLSKKIDPMEVQNNLQSIESEVNKPEVIFIKYKTEEEAILAQHNIKAQYENLEGNTIISNELLSNIKTPSEIYDSTKVLQKEIHENRNYLPPVHNN